MFEKIKRTATRAWLKLLPRYFRLRVYICELCQNESLISIIIEATTIITITTTTGSTITTTITTAAITTKTADNSGCSIRKLLVRCTFSFLVSLKNEWENSLLILPVPLIFTWRKPFCYYLEILV